MIVLNKITNLTEVEKRVKWEDSYVYFVHVAFQMSMAPPVWNIQYEADDVELKLSSSWYLYLKIACLKITELVEPNEVAKREYKGGTGQNY